MEGMAGVTGVPRWRLIDTGDQAIGGRRGGMVAVYVTAAVAEGREGKRGGDGGGSRMSMGFYVGGL